MDHLFLGDLKNMTEEEVRNHIISDYETTKEAVDRFDILLAYESVGSWGCDSSSWFLLRDKETEKLYENSGSHCSCYGFEGQFEPDETDIEYLKSDNFCFWTGGYDEYSEENRKAVEDYIKNMIEETLAEPIQKAKEEI